MVEDIYIVFINEDRYSVKDSSKKSLREGFTVSIVGRLEDEYSRQRRAAIIIARISTLL